MGSEGGKADTPEQQEGPQQLNSSQQQRDTIRDLLRQEINASNSPDNKSIPELIREAADNRFDEKLGRITSTLLKAPIIAGAGVFLAIIINVLAPNIYHIWLDMQNIDAKKTIYKALEDYTDRQIDTFLATNTKIDEYEKQIISLNNRISLIDLSIDKLNTKILNTTNSIDDDIKTSKDLISKKFDKIEQLRRSLDIDVNDIKSQYESDIQTIETSTNEITSVRDRIISASERARGISSIVEELNSSRIIFEEAVSTSDEFSSALAIKITNYLTRRKNAALTRIFSESIPIGTALMFPINQIDIPDMLKKEKEDGSSVYDRFCSDQNLDFYGIVRLSYTIDDSDSDSSDKGFAIKCWRPPE